MKTFISSVTGALLLFIFNSPARAADIPPVPVPDPSSVLCPMVQGIPCSVEQVRDAVNAAVADAEGCLSSGSSCPVTVNCALAPAACNALNAVLDVARACLDGASGCPAPQPPPVDPSRVYGTVNYAIGVAQSCLSGTPGCPDIGVINCALPGLSTACPIVDNAINSVLETARDCINGSVGCPAPQPPPVDPSPVYAAVAQAVAAVQAITAQVQACANGSPSCPVPPPPPVNPNPLYAAVAEAVALVQGVVDLAQAAIDQTVATAEDVKDQAVREVENCVNGSPGCPAPQPPPVDPGSLGSVSDLVEEAVAGVNDVPEQVQSAGLGGYVSCVVSDLTIDHVRGALGAAATAAGAHASAQGSGQCTKDPDGRVGFVDVTFEFEGLESPVQGSPVGAACSGESGSQTNVIPGTFRLYESANPSVAVASEWAALAIKGYHLDPTTRAMNVELDVPAAGMKSFLQVTNVDAPGELVGWADRDLPVSLALEQVQGVPPYDSFFIPQVPAVMPAFGSCRESIHLIGGLNTIEPPDLDTGLPAGDTNTDPMIAQLPLLETVVPALPEIVQEVPQIGDEGVELDVDTAAALSLVIDRISTLFDLGDPTPSVDSSFFAQNGPFAINVKYRTLTGGTATVTSLGAPGVRTPVMVPNANNNGIPEPIYVTVLLNLSEAGDSKFSLTIERAPPAICKQLPIDVAVVGPPLDQVQALTNIGVQLGFDALSAGGNSPARFVIGYSRTSGSSGRNSTATVDMLPACGAASIGSVAVTGRYQNALEDTDLSLRIPTEARHLGAIMSRSGGVNTLAYAATHPASFYLSGTEAGFPLNVQLLNLSKKMELCTAKGNVCAMPWRKAKTLTNAGSFSSLNGSGYSPITLNLLMHSPTYDAAGNVSADTEIRATNLRLSSFAYDVRTSGNPRHAYLTTFKQDVSGKVETAAGGQSTSIEGSFWALDREVTIKKVKWYQGGYRVRNSGQMHCDSLKIKDSSLPWWQEDLAERVLCYGGSWGW